jgi:aspartate racemase
VITPTDEEKEFVNQKISEELELGIIKHKTPLLKEVTIQYDKHW